MDIKEKISKVMKQVFFGIVNHTYFGILWECTGLIV